MINVQHISIQLQEQTIVQDISFSIPPGKILMLLGENGCGKTTLIKGMIHELPLQKGTIDHQGNDFARMSRKERAALFSYIPQIKPVISNMYCKDIVVSGLNRHLTLFDIPKEKDYEQARTIMAKFQIESLFEEPIDTISGGQLQLVYLCRAFIQDAQCILMDEPCTYLDFMKQHLFLRYTKELTKHGHSVLLSIHDPQLALAYGDEILFMHQGKLIADIKKEEIDMAAQLEELYRTIYHQDVKL